MINNTVFSLTNVTFLSLLKYGSVLLLKMVLMSLVTVIYRIIYRSVASEEDALFRVGGDKEKRKSLLMKNWNVERVRNAHMNDIENIVPFFIIAILYVTIRPDPAMAEFLFKVFTASRIAHTTAYLGKIRQPVRSLAFIAGLFVNIYMIWQIMKKVF
uniref:microsomal glutathione S-transferase 1-like isoform X1 n=1 Tax=Styela clava TaxID=7725 RepID=UPI00193A7F83|nr:microsomal glutathione S-transferase 1-like isoform X1 [Styela clava]